MPTSSTSAYCNGPGDEKTVSDLAIELRLTNLTRQNEENLTKFRLQQPYGNVLRRGQELLDDGALQHILNISAVSGFPWADTEKNGFTVIVTARDRDDPTSVAVAREAAVELGQLAWSQLPQFKPDLTGLDECVRAAHAAAESAKPIVLCDCADNPGAGARGNTTYVLKALLKAKVPRVFAGVFNDPALYVTNRV